MEHFQRWANLIDSESGSFDADKLVTNLQDAEFSDTMAAQVNDLRSIPLATKKVIQKGIDTAKDGSLDKEALSSLEQLQSFLWLKVINESNELVDNFDKKVSNWKTFHIYPKWSALNLNRYPLLTVGTKLYDISQVAWFTNNSQSMKLQDKEQNRMIEIINDWGIVNIDIKQFAIPQAKKEDVKEAVTWDQDKLSKWWTQSKNKIEKIDIPQKEIQIVTTEPRKIRPTPKIITTDTKDITTDTKDITTDTKDVKDTNLKEVDKNRIKPSTLTTEQKIASLASNTFVSNDFEWYYERKWLCAKHCRKDLKKITNWTFVELWNDSDVVTKWGVPIPQWNAVDLIKEWEKKEKFDTNFAWSVNDINLYELRTYFHNRVLQNKWSIFDCYMKFDWHDKDPLNKSHRLLIYSDNQWALMVLDSALTGKTHPIAIDHYFNHHLNRDNTNQVYKKFNDKDFLISKTVYYPENSSESSVAAN